MLRGPRQKGEYGAGSLALKARSQTYIKHSKGREHGRNAFPGLANQDLESLFKYVAGTPEESGEVVRLG